MAYMTTREASKYLRINEKKIYSMLAENQLPATRVSGKWLFDKTVLDKWLSEKTVYPTGGLLGGLLEKVLIIQGSDDWLLDKALDTVRESAGFDIASTKVGSFGGIEALAAGRAHAAGFHLKKDDVPGILNKMPCYVIDLFSREQVLAVRKGSKDSTTISGLARPGTRFAYRQKSSGTYRLTEQLFKKHSVDKNKTGIVGPFTTHIEAALAVLSGKADATITIRVAAELCGLEFTPVATEEFRMVLPSEFFSHTNVTSFMDKLMDGINSSAIAGTPGYDTGNTGRLSTSVKSN